MFGADEATFEKSTHKEDLKTLNANFETSEGNFVVELIADKSP